MGNKPRNVSFSCVPYRLLGRETNPKIIHIKYEIANDVQRPEDTGSLSS